VEVPDAATSKVELEPEPSTIDRTLHCGASRGWRADGLVGKQTLELWKVNVYVVVAGVAASMTAEMEEAESTGELAPDAAGHWTNTLAVNAPVASVKAMKTPLPTTRGATAT
jgi:hypothetical protein